MARRPGIFQPRYTEAGPDGKRTPRTSKTWAYRFELHGRTYQKAGFETAATAQAARDQRRTEVRAGQEQDWRRLTVMGLHQMAAARKVTWDASTGTSFDAAWKRLFRFLLPEHRVAEIDDTRLLEFVAFRKREGAAVNTIRLDLAVLRAAMKLAHQKRLLPWLPAFPTLKRQRREQTVQPVQLEALLEHMPDYYRLFFEAAAEMGWRARSELRTRRWTHVDLGPASWSCCGAVLTVDACACGAGRPGWVELDAASSKTDERRVFPMTRVLRGILDRARAHADAVQLRAGAIVPWVFCRDDGQPIGDYRKAWATALRKAGVGKLEGRSGPWSSAQVAHDLRRTAIRRWRRDLTREVSKGLAGHASDEAHSVYEAREDLDALREAARLLDQRRGDGEIQEKVVQLSLWRR